MADVPEAESEAVHDFKNQLAIIIGYSGLLLSEMPEGDPKWHDIVEINKAATAALRIFNDRLKGRLR